jgi:hypothetical protein
MRICQVILLGGALFLAATSADARLLHGGSATFEGKTWEEALAKLPCQSISKDGKDLKISATLVVDGTAYQNPAITKEDLIKPVDRRCFSKH